MVRRLKSDLRRIDPRSFPKRTVEPIALDGLRGTAPELRLPQMVAAYGELCAKRIARLAPRDAANAKLAFVGLQQRLLSSIAAFLRTLERLCFGEAVLAVFRATNLLSPFEKTRLQEVLRGRSADPFIRAAARFTLNPTTAALLDMERALKPHDAAKWTVVTYLPFLWRPEAHMFLKPEVTKDFAARVGHRFASDYEPRLRLDVYQSLLDLASETEQELADLDPRDRIDVQSFIWVVGDYKQDTKPPRP